MNVMRKEMESRHSTSQSTPPSKFEVVHDTKRKSYLLYNFLRTRELFAHFKK